MYLLWYDDNPKKTTQAKIAEAVAAYTARFHSTPNTVLCNEGERVDVPGILVRSEGYIRQSNFWIGFEDGVS